MSRPEKWKDEYLGIAKGACALGATDQELADLLGLSVRTIYYWRASRPEFAEALSVGKEIADERVERSLYQKATGYDITEEQAVKVRLEQFRDGVEVVEVRKHVVADTTAAIFWLKNRRKNDWRDKSEHEVTLPQVMSEWFNGRADGG